MKITERRGFVAARDIASHLHPYTNFKKHEESGPLTIVRGRGFGSGGGVGPIRRR